MPGFTASQGQKVLLEDMERIRQDFPDAITSVFADTEIQTCTVHLIRNSLSFCNWKQRQPVYPRTQPVFFNALNAPSRLPLERLPQLVMFSASRRSRFVYIFQAACWKRRFHIKETAVSPDEVMSALRRYLKNTGDTERAVALKMGVNRHTLCRWLSDEQSPKKGKMALAAFFLKQAGNL